MFDLVPYEPPIEGDLLDAEQNCQIAGGDCTNTGVALVEDPYEADVNDTPGQLVRACPECLYQSARDI